jgi:hypothetical protein
LIVIQIKLRQTREKIQLAWQTTRLASVPTSVGIVPVKPPRSIPQTAKSVKRAISILKEGRSKDMFLKMKKTV